MAAIVIMAHVGGLAACVSAQDMIWVDGVSGLSLAIAAGVIAGTEHGGHPVVGWLFSLWAMRLSGHLVMRRVLLGKRRARCMVPSAREATAFAISRLVWAMCMIVTIRSSPGVGSRIRYELVALALFALAFEAYADGELLLFRVRDGEAHRHYSKGLWRFCRHPNMLGELLFQSAVCLIAMFRAPHKLHATAGLTITAVGILLLPGGVKTLEDRAKRAWGTDPAFQEYRESTPLLLPLSACCRPEGERRPGAPERRSFLPVSTAGSLEDGAPAARV